MREKYYSLVLYITITITITITVTVTITITITISKGYQPEARGYVIYSPRALPEGAARGCQRFSHVSLGMRDPPREGERSVFMATSCRFSLSSCVVVFEYCTSFSRVTLRL